jgi:DNA-binding response OmpR family regulator
MSKKTLLVVDDSPTALMMNTMLLGRQPYNIVSAKDGQEAVEKAIASPPDLVVMDVMMPRMNGIEACRAIRQNESTRLVPVILIPTRGEEEYVAQGFAAGCNDYVTKPVNATELVAKVRALLGE